MVIVKEIEKTDITNRKVYASLFADAKSEVSPSMEIVGMVDGYDLGVGSSVMTADGELAFLKSNNTWNWL